jgi:cyclopropane-fatty-acyl-phospholipid synthase
MNTLKVRDSSPTERVSERAMELVSTFFGVSRVRDFTVRLWDGKTWSPDPSRPARFTMVFRHPGTLRQLILHPGELSLGSAFIHADLDLEGDIDVGFELVFDLIAHDWKPRERLRLAAQALLLPAADSHLTDGRASSGPSWIGGRLRTREEDRQAIAYHYDVSNDFYALWLDPRMLYTCAYFRTPVDDLDRAQVQKLDHVCRKLRLRPGERLLDLGCGWGGLVMHAARHYGVRARGVTLSQAQTDWARDRISQLGLEESCRVDNLDYRDLNEPSACDKMACIGMFEHVGEAGLPDAFRRCRSLLRPGGCFLLHGITRDHARPLDYKNSFSCNLVFPNGELEPISTILAAAEAAGWEIRDVENLREHYARTCKLWFERLEARRGEALRHVDETTFRTWWMYLAGSAFNFRQGNIGLYQTLLYKPRAQGGESGMPLTREDWYG